MSCDCSYDLFGLALRDYVEGRYGSLFIERDDGYIKEMDLSLYFKSHKDWPSYEREAISHVRGRVLDIGCGAGRHALYLQKKRHEVIALDLSYKVAKIARDRGCSNVLVMDARLLGFRPNTFDTILLMGNNFGLAGDERGTVKLLRQIYSIGRERAIIVTTCRDPKETGNPAHLAYHERNRRNGLPIGQLRLRFKYRGMIGPWFKLLILTPKEMEDLCNRVSWKVVRIWKGSDGMYSAVIQKV